MTADLYDEEYGVDIHLMGAYLDPAVAGRRKADMEKKYKDVAMNEVEADKDCDIYLGNYIE